MPCRGPRFPQKSADRTPVFLQSGSAPFCVEIILIPDCAFCLRRGQGSWREDVLNGIPANKDGGTHAVRLEYCRYGGSAAAPVESGDGKASQAKRIGEIDDILTDCRLFGHAGMGRIQEAGRSISTQIRN